MFNFADFFFFEGDAMCCWTMCLFISFPRVWFILRQRSLGQKFSLTVVHRRPFIQLDSQVHVSFILVRFHKSIKALCQQASRLHLLLSNVKKKIFHLQLYCLKSLDTNHLIFYFLPFHRLLILEQLHISHNTRVNIASCCSSKLADWKMCPEAPVNGPWFVKKKQSLVFCFD